MSESSPVTYLNMSGTRRVESVSHQVIVQWEVIIITMNEMYMSYN